MFRTRFCCRLFHMHHQQHSHGPARNKVRHFSVDHRISTCPLDKRWLIPNRNTRNQSMFCVRRWFSSKWEIPSNVTTLEDIGDDFIDEPLPSSHEPRKRENKYSGSRRVKVKFNRKNALVTADSLNLFENLYTTYPKLIEFRENDLLGYIELMSSYAIDVDKAAEMLLIYPSILTVTPSKVSAIIGTLQGMGVSERKRKHLLRRCPQLFDIGPKTLGKQFSFIKTFLSIDETLEAVETSVEILLESEKTLKQKLEYLIKSMSHEPKYIVCCKALSYPLKHMKTRHEFLIRAGLFKPIPYRKFFKVMEKEYKDRNKPRAKYFKPLLVVCYKDEDFLKYCTNDALTLNELAAFEELYSAELEVESDEQENDLNSEIKENYDDEDAYAKDAVSLVKSTNSVGFFNDVELKSCYF